MKKQLLMWSMIIAGIAIACHKESSNQPAPPGTTSLKLKDINARNLPPPSIILNMMTAEKLRLCDYSSGLRTYDVDYNGNHIESMENIADLSHCRLEYEYSNGDLLAVRVKDKDGVTLRHCIFSFSSSHQLQQMDWDVADGNVGFYLEQTLTFSYYADGNVMDIVTHNYPVGPQAEATYTDRFENYDDHANADGFTLLHTTGHELVLIPGLKFQVNNPRRNIHTGDGINFEINYSYTYDSKGRPTVKTGDVNFTNGANTGQHFESQSTFSYYD